MQNTYSIRSKIFLSCDYLFDKTCQIFLFVRERLSKTLKYDDLSMHSLPLQNISLSDQVNKCLKIYFLEAIVEAYKPGILFVLGIQDCVGVSSERLESSVIPQGTVE